MTDRERLLTDLLREYKERPIVSDDNQGNPGPKRSTILSELEGRLSQEREAMRQAREQLFHKNQKLREKKSPGERKA